MEAQDRLAGQKILVTGASGFIGTHLCQRLSSNGAETHAVSRSSHVSERENLRWWHGDLGKIGTVRSLLSSIKPDIIFHLASHVAGDRSLALVLPTLYGNLLTTVHLLTAATEIGCRRIILSGSLEEPDPGHPDPIPSSPYAAAKWASSGYARMFYELYQAPVVIARLFMVYGPGQQDLRKLIPYVTLCLLKGEAPKLTSGERQVDWIYVDDIVNGLVAAAQTPNVEGCTIDLGSGALVPIRTVVQHLVDLTRSNMTPIFGSLPERPLEQVRVANAADAYARLGWKPAFCLEEGLRRTVAWYGHQLKSLGALT